MSQTDDLRAEYEEAQRAQHRWQMTMVDEGHRMMAEDYQRRAATAQGQLNGWNPADALGIQKLQLEIEHFSEMANYADLRFDQARMMLTGQG